MPIHQQERSIYLTFDDGPKPEVTDFVLEQLAAYGAKATFFCIGHNVMRYPETYQKVVEAGHSIGNHTYNHLKGWQTPRDVYLENIKRCGELVGSPLFRPPYGRISLSQIRALRKQNAGKQWLLAQRETAKIIMWDVVSGDFDEGLSKEACYQHVVDNAQSGSIVVFHDSVKAFERLFYALPKVLAFFARQNYEFKSIQY